MKFNIDEITKNPVVITITLVISSCMTIFISQNYASVEYLELRINEVKHKLDNENDKINTQLVEIKHSIKEVDKNILEIYKSVKYQEGRNGN